MKRAIIITLLAIITLAYTVNADVTTDIVYFYELDETSGTSFNDSTPNNYNGASSGTTWTTGLISNAIEATPSGSSEFFYTTDNIPRGQLVDWTMQLWWNPVTDSNPSTGIAYYERWVMNYASSNDDRIEIGLAGNDGSPSYEGSIYVSIDTGAAASTFGNLAFNTSTNSWEADTWYHIVMGYNHLTDEFFMYVNGTKEISASCTDCNWANLSADTQHHFNHYGSAALGGNAWFSSDARFDNVALWNSSLTQSDVTNLYNSGAGLSYADTIAIGAGTTNNNIPDVYNYEYTGDNQYSGESSTTWQNVGGLVNISSGAIAFTFDTNVTANCTGRLGTEQNYTTMFSTNSSYLISTNTKNHTVVAFHEPVEGNTCLYISCTSATTTNETGPGVSSSGCLNISNLGQEPDNALTGLVWYYSLDEGAGNNLNDSTGANPGLSVDMTWNSSGKFGSGLQGLIQNTRYFQNLGPALNNGKSQFRNFSYQVWFNPRRNIISSAATTNNRFYRRLLSNYGAGSGDTIDLSFVGWDGGSVLNNSIAWYSTANASYGFNNLSFNTSTRLWYETNWYHIMLTCEEGVALKIFVNGTKEVDAYVPDCGITALNDGPYFYINQYGGDIEIEDYSESILFDEVAMWNRTLNESTVIELYNSSYGVQYESFGTVGRAGGEAPPADTCTCPGIDSNWEIDLGDTCTLTTACDLGTGTLTFTGTGSFTCDATLDTTNLGDPGSGGLLTVNDDCRINVD